VPLIVSVALDRIEDRKLHLSAEIAADRQVTVDAEAVFLALTEKNMETVFGGPVYGEPSATGRSTAG
jgi:hypothetical protein